MHASHIVESSFSEEDLEVLTVKLRDKPTIGHAFKAWLSYSQAHLSAEEFRSVKNFARAYLIWLPKEYRLKPEQLDTDSIHAGFLVDSIHYFALELQLSGDPVIERLVPSSKTTYIGTNARRFIGFLNEQGLLSRDETLKLLQQCTVMEDDCKRCQRVKWVMTQQELFFEPRVGGRARRTVLQGSAIEGVYEVADIGENFVLADMCGEEGKLISSSENPYKIQVPRPVASLLKPGDDLRITIKKAAGADYWVPISFTNVHAGTDKFEPVATSVQTLDSEIDKFLSLSTSMSKDKNHGETKSHVDTKSKPELKRKASHEVQLALVRGDEMYQKRREELLRGTALPGEGFPEAMYTDNWFREREHDLTSDEDVYKMGEDADDEDLGDEGDDFGEAD